MIDHISLPVSDYQKSKAFYLRALKPLGYELVMELDRSQIPTLPVPVTCGIGPGGKPNLWLRPSATVTPTHVAITAKDAATVKAFYEAALAAGGKDNGEPGPRRHYHPKYYGAFVLDPDGYNIEAVCHTGA